MVLITMQGRQHNTKNNDYYYINKNLFCNGKCCRFNATLDASYHWGIKEMSPQNDIQHLIPDPIRPHL